jgi:hypothetical protein
MTSRPRPARGSSGRRRRGTADACVRCLIARRSRVLTVIDGDCAHANIDARRLPVTYQAGGWWQGTDDSLRERSLRAGLSRRPHRLHPWRFPATRSARRSPATSTPATSPRGVRNNGNGSCGRPRLGSIVAGQQLATLGSCVLVVRHPVRDRTLADQQRCSITLLFVLLFLGPRVSNGQEVMARTVAGGMRKCD